jgi:hypothetical protein
MSDASYHKYLQAITYVCSFLDLQTMRAQVRAFLKYSASISINFADATLILHHTLFNECSIVII